ncbi:MAG: IgGFc-binding protein [Deltaproteobacteria bacterium]|nr:IgGFc-binding protein [Deltaproteobacteria bacterium]
MVRRTILCSVVAATSVLAAVSSCGSDRDRIADVQEEAGSSSGTSSGFTNDAGEGGAGEVSCSSDLRSVIDSQGRVLEECPPDKGCAGGGCVPACESAQANKSTIGCSYFVAAPDIISVGTGACFAAFVANTWVTPVKLTVERSGTPLDVSAMARVPSGSGQSITYAPLVNGEILPGQVAIVFLSRFGANLTSCPAGITPGYVAGPANVSGTGRGVAFNIKTTAPVVAYDIFPYGGGASAATSATLLIPTSAWGRNYVAVNAFRKSVRVPEGNPFLQIIGQEDGTEVELLPVAAIAGGGGVPASAANATAKYTLDKGQVLQIGQAAELTGSAIASNKPVGVNGGASCLSIDVNDEACDSAHQALPPVNALGSRYVAARYRNRYDGQEESPPWRLVGAVDGTVLSWEPAAPAGAPTTLKSGQVAEVKSPGGFVVKSQDDKHPFYLSAHMAGCGTFNNAFDCRGDPEFVNVIPPEQYLRSYVFFTDPTYPETNLVVVRAKTNGVFKDVELDCAGKLSGWQPIGADFELTRVDLVRGNFQKQGSCDNGRHEMKSEAPFGLTVWGWGSAASGLFSSQAVSYAYPAGASVKPVNTVVVGTGPR